MAQCPDCYGFSEEGKSAGDGKCRECFGTGKDQSLIDDTIEGEAQLSRIGDVSNLRGNWRSLRAYYHLHAA
jgi:hypothetical protein